MNLSPPRSLSLRGLWVLGALALVSCGGGGGDGVLGDARPPAAPAPPPAEPSSIVCTSDAPVPQGVYGAQVSPGNETLVLVSRPIPGWPDLGPVGFIGTDTGSAFVVSSAFSMWPFTCRQGSASWNTASRALIRLSIDAAPTSLSGQITEAASTRTLVGGPVPGASYDYNQPASLSDAAGTLSTSGNDKVYLSIAADGTAMFGPTGQQRRGTVVPSADGKNLLTLSVPPLPGSGFAMTGLVLTYSVAGGGRRLFAYVYESDGWDGTEYFLTGTQ